MARKGSQQKNAIGRSSPNVKKKGSEIHAERGQHTDVKVSSRDVPLNRQQSNSSSAESMREGAGKSVNLEKQGVDPIHGLEQSTLSAGYLGGDIQNASPTGASLAREQNGLHGDYTYQNRRKSHLGEELNGHMRKLMENVHLLDNALVRNMRKSALSVLKAAGEWLEKQRPFLLNIKVDILQACDYVRMKIDLAYPFVLKWLVHFGNIMFLLSMIWLDCTLRGIDSFLRMGTTSFFSIIWCSIFSVIAMVGMSKFLLILVLAVLVGIFIGFGAALLLLAVSGTIFLWLYGSFWTTALIIVLAGIAFMLSRERLALSIATIYAVYSAWSYVGWISLLFSLNLSFISSDVLIYFLKNNINQHQRSNNPPKQTTRMHDQHFNSETLHSSSPDADAGLSADHNSGSPSTSGANSEITSEDEVIRLLNCSDHYSVLGFNRYENIDVSLLKREYRKKAMLVHPDKNQGNDKAVEAFKKLQNAYEVLLDSFKRKAYDDELRREELLNCFRRFQSASQMNGGHGLFASGFARSETDGEDPLRDSRRIACKKCDNFHAWLQTRKLKSQARWCQDCKEFHQAKDGDGWVEQSSQPFLFGLLQKMNAPAAYVCADSRIYDATEWYICQGMRCPPNTHKPSFHVNTSVTSKHNSGKSTSGQRGGRFPSSNVEETMTEAEFFEWLQNAVQAGVFDNFSGSHPENQSPMGGSSSKSSGSGSCGGSGNKKKKRGKKQW